MVLATGLKLTRPACGSLKVFTLHRQDPHWSAEAELAGCTCRPAPAVRRTNVAISCREIIFSGTPCRRARLHSQVLVTYVHTSPSAEPVPVHDPASPAPRLDDEREYRKKA